MFVWERDQLTGCKEVKTFCNFAIYVNRLMLSETSLLHVTRVRAYGSLPHRVDGLELDILEPSKFCGSRPLTTHHHKCITYVLLL